MIGLPLTMVVAVTAGGLGVGAWGVRLARTTSDLFVASRAISPWWNAAAISGEYLSAASFLGIAGLAMKLGAVAIWLPIGYTAGYLALLLFVAAPLRRFGSYTIPDFAEARLGAPRMRIMAAVVVLGISGFYLVPQLKGAGIALRQVTGAPYWVGIVAVGSLVSLNVALGGMRGITYVQAYQYWVKTFAIALPACLLVIHFGGLPGRAALFGADYPSAPQGGLTVHLDSAQKVRFPEATTYVVNGRTLRTRADALHNLPKGTLELPAGAAVPVVDGVNPKAGERWSRPVGGGPASSPLLVYSLLIATFLGTMGLPHILVRFYTNPDGDAARRTTVRVLGLLGLFYVFPGVYAALGRALVPRLYVTGDTDLVVLQLPQAAWPGTVGDILAGVVAAGAFAAFVSTASGLLVSLAGTLSHDLAGRRARMAPARRRFAVFRVAAVGGMVVPAAVALAARDIDIAILVGWAFALAASTFCPLFLLGIWWDGLTAEGAAAGIAVGAIGATAAIFTGLLLDIGTDGIGALLAQPAAITVPAAFATMILVSLRGRAPESAHEHMLVLHAPEVAALPGR